MNKPIRTYDVQLDNGNTMTITLDGDGFEACRLANQQCEEAAANAPVEGAEPAHAVRYRIPGLNNVWQRLEAQ